MKNIKKLMGLLALLSLPAIQAMDQDERKDDGNGIVIPVSFDPEVEEQYYTPAEALLELHKEEEYEDALFRHEESAVENRALEQKVLNYINAFPQVIAHVIAQYAHKGKIEKGDYFDRLIDETPLYAAHLPPQDFSRNREILKALFYQKLEQSFPAEKNMTLTEVLKHGDDVWKEILKTNPFSRKNKATRGWKISRDREKIFTCFIVFEKSEDELKEDQNVWYILVYDIENNSVINLIRLERTRLSDNSLELLGDSSFTVMNRIRYKEISKFPVITYHPDSNTFSAKAEFHKEGQSVKTVHFKYSPQKEDFVEESVEETPIEETPILQAF